MRFSIVCASLLLQVVSSYAQIQEHFSYPHIDSATVWKGTDSAWQLQAGRLQSHSRKASSSFYLSTPSSLARNCSWEWWMRLDFNTSSLNYVDVYLTANIAELTSASIKGYFVRIGNTKDEVCLYRKGAATNPVMIIDGRDGLTDHSSSLLKVKVVCNGENEWSLWTDESGTGKKYVLEGTVKDTALATSGYMGFAVRQSTASFFEKHFLDDVEIASLVRDTIKDTVAPRFQSLQLIGDRELNICFSEPLDNNTLSQEGHFLITGTGGHLSRIWQDSSALNCVKLLWDSAFPNGDSCRLQVKGVRDMAGNMITSFDTAFLYYKADTIYDLVINEVLYDPASGVPEFVELYNRGTQPVSLDKLYLTKRKSNGETDAPAILSKQEILLFPGGYAAFTTDPGSLCIQYNCQQPEHIYKMSLPALINKEGTVVLSKADGKVVDEFHYTDSMHFALADHTKGVSLERLDAGLPTQDPQNWHSAAATAGFATPGFANSQGLQLPGVPGELTITPEVFSPDNDGTDDVTVIRYELPSPGYVANITIYDAAGRPVRYLQHNILLAVKGQMIWDGLGEANKTLTTGIYIVFIEMFNLEGRVKRWKLPLVLAKRMN
ncbi:Lamin Tail Domain [Chitinophaga sp. CF118]|uniref:lamin tail domain-containing protein n=1 Tax=Chitinophaga sp. CF118 TaxID=1884367 RepID=UPI0008E6649C|nr:lamin tail domain-containing protein [Chitinophaga sp. CF118]SFD31129.1 Lamin Tail Domain [Chitinophaga sp. CF118]